MKALKILVIVMLCASAGMAQGRDAVADLLFHLRVIGAGLRCVGHGSRFLVRPSGCIGMDGYRV